jgi:hypothetical protein
MIVPYGYFKKAITQDHLAFVGNTSSRADGNLRPGDHSASGSSKSRNSRISPNGAMREVKSEEQNQPRGCGTIRK